MSTPARTILRCELNPAKWDQSFINRITGATPVIPKGGGVDFWFYIFNEDGATPMDIANISDIAILVKGAGSWQQIGSTVTAQNPNVTKAQWDAGQGAHFIVSLLGTDTNLTAGDYDLTVKGHTTDDAVDLDCFGITDLKILDVGLTDAAPVEPSEATVESIVRPLLEGFLTTIGKPGVNRVEVSPNGLWRRISGIDDNGQFYDRPEQVS